MDSAIRIGSSILLPTSSSSTPKLSNLQRNDKIGYGFRFSGNGCITKISAITPKGSVFPSASSHGVSSFLLSLFYFQSSSMRYVHGRRSSLESLFCYDTPIPEERIEEPVAWPLVIHEAWSCGMIAACHFRTVVVEQGTSCAQNAVASVILDRSKLLIEFFPFPFHSLDATMEMHSFASVSIANGA
ncbi:hypothetical protein DKX38_029266 [Salix brachista]|uniref:Uncharacterized protein n=1 Tax=Salix brachista TaxID=2182728 RepID=A0A5N5IYQ0_9ROSI|nr:hypothetical protein DKX38_029266 [Salix brachista]